MPRAPSYDENATMDKVQLLLRAGRDVPPDAFGVRVRGEIVPRLLSRDPARLTVTFTEVAPPALTVIPFRRSRIALFSIWPREGDDDASAWADAIDPEGRASVAGYRVDESVPVAYQQTWEDGQTTPGVGILTIFRRRPGLDDETFLARWHGGHTPMSLEIHPLYAYVRNVVGAPVVEGSPPCDAIVQEHFRHPADLLDPTRFFGGLAAMVPNMLRVARDIRGFIDLRSMEVYFVSELVVRS